MTNKHVDSEESLNKSKPWSRKPTDQPDADGRIFRGGLTKYWQPYMADADLGDYHHAPESAVEDFKDLKYGIRIIWGVYSIIHGQASLVLLQNNGDYSKLAFQGFYHELYRSWYPHAFNADRWTDMFKENGFKFFVLTNKHLDGFSMYDTKATIYRRTKFFGENAGSIEDCNLNYSIMETPFKRDITGELVDAARKRDLKIGLFYSHVDWYDADMRFDETNPNFDSAYSPESEHGPWGRACERHKLQIKELLSKYGKVDMLCFDSYWPAFTWKHIQSVIRYARRLQPKCMFRWRGIGNYGDYYTPQNCTPDPDEDMGTMPWQLIQTISKRNLFSYEPDEQYIQSGEWIIATLIDTVAKGGNLMVAAGPDSTGTWHPKVLESLDYAGKWLKINGEAIYKTRPCNTCKDGNIYFTRSKDNSQLYAISMKWTGNSIRINNVTMKKEEVYLLGYSQALKWEHGNGGINISLPAELQKEENRPCKPAYTFKIAGEQTR